jgi:hypothetical protein
MLAIAFVASFTTLATAAAITHRAPPPTLKGTGFTLVVNVTDPTRDMTPSVHGYEVQAWHMAASLSRAVPTPPGHGNIFYQNGTGPEKYRWGSTIQTELGPKRCGSVVWRTLQRAQGQT